jgi:regulator of protease activity HflC (stomatin/prohibitin superfamily)|tara:strand:+ start:74 stop:484 length:411 start_codon:yes stop_codon:yes gene_type:complete
LINEARREYNRIIPLAEGERDQRIREADGYRLKRINEAEGDALCFNALFAEYQQAPEVTRRRIYTIDKRILEWEGTLSDMPTKDKLYISVSLYARWQVTDPLQYFLRLGNKRSAQSRLDDIFGSETRNAVATHELI